MKKTIFSEELRECLDAAGLSDCGENDTWNYWYQRLMNAYNESVERQIMTEQAENAKLRELAVLNWEWAHSCCGNNCKMQTDGCGYQIGRECNYEREIYDRACELGIELNDYE